MVLHHSTSSRPSGGLHLALLLLLALLLNYARAFLPTHHGPRTQCRPHHGRRIAAAAAAAADANSGGEPEEDGGKGFMLRWKPPPPPQSEDESEAIRKEWELSYKKYIKTNGANLCALAWRGYEKFGRGAIVAKQRPGEEEEVPVPDGIEAFEGKASAMYVPLARWAEGLEAAQAMDGDLGLTSGALRRILERVLGYDPEGDFVVVYETPRLCGADIVRPSITPPIMAERLMPEGGGSGSQVEDRGAINVTGQEVDE